jgi:hypothetical protein
MSAKSVLSIIYVITAAFVFVAAFIHFYKKDKNVIYPAISASMLSIFWLPVFSCFFFYSLVNALIRDPK